MGHGDFVGGVSLFISQNFLISAKSSRAVSQTRPAACLRTWLAKYSASCFSFDVSSGVGIGFIIHLVRPYIRDW
jgi:hypothetical protein